MNTPTKKPNRKRTISSGDDASQSSISSQGSDSSNTFVSPILTPTKMQKKFKFWSSSKTEESGETTKNQGHQSVKDEAGVNKEQTIANLTTGRKLDKILKFRVSLVSAPKGNENCQVFNMHGLDNSGEICFTAFRVIAEKCQSYFQVNKTYKIENFNVKLEDQSFRSGSGHLCKIVIDEKTEYLEIENDAIKQIPFNFVPLKELENLSVNNTIGVLVKDCGLKTTSKGVTVRQLFITDASIMENVETISLSLWQNEALDFKGEYGNIIAIRKAKLGKIEDDFILNVKANTLLWINPSVEEAGPLLEWFLEAVEEKKKN